MTCRSTDTAARCNRALRAALAGFDVYVDEKPDGVWLRVTREGQVAAFRAPPLSAELLLAMRDAQSEDMK